MERLFLLFIGLCFILTNVFGQNDAEQFAESITASDLNEYLTYLASDELKGRRSGEEGQKLAAEFISNRFNSDNIQNVSGDNFFQYFELENIPNKEVTFIIGDNSYKNYREFAYFGYNEVEEFIEKEIVFVGYGSQEELKGVELKNKAILIFGEDISSLMESTDRIRKEFGNDVFLIALPNNKKIYRKILLEYYFSKKLFLPGKRGDVLNKIYNESRQDMKLFMVNNDICEDITNLSIRNLEKQAKKCKKGKNSLVGISCEKMKYKTKYIHQYQTVTTENVLGYIEGTDKKDELVILTAHYDHEGVTENGEVFNGADDNASGTSALIEIAQAFALAKKAGNGPRRSVLFIAFSAEELGLCGSKYYVENPIFPLSSTAVVLNVDMIGRSDDLNVFEVFMKKEKAGGENDNKQIELRKPDYVYVLPKGKTKKSLKKLNKNINRQQNDLELDFSPGLFKRLLFSVASDHYPFYKKDVPVIVYSTGLSSDLHKISDTVDKIDFNKMEKITRHIFYTMWEIVNDPENNQLR